MRMTPSTVIAMLAASLSDRFSCCFKTRKENRITNNGSRESNGITIETASMLKA